MANQYKATDESKSIQAHHSVEDGLHIGQFADALQNYLNRF